MKPLHLISKSEKPFKRIYQFTKKDLVLISGTRYIQINIAPETYLNERKQGKAGLKNESR